MTKKAEPYDLLSDLLDPMDIQWEYRTILVEAEARLRSMAAKTHKFWSFEYIILLCSMCGTRSPELVICSGLKDGPYHRANAFRELANYKALISQAPLTTRSSA